MKAKEIFSVLFYNIVPLISLVGAFILAYNKIDGWGWFLFIALVLYGIPKMNITTDEKPKKSCKCKDKSEDCEEK